MNSKKIAIIVLGKPNSGKSKTWYELFGRKIRSGHKELIINKLGLKLFVKNSSFEEMKQKISLKVFLKNSSFEESGGSAKKYLYFKSYPNLILCSVQYTERGKDTLDWFVDNGYYLYIQWLNPGYMQKREYSDNLKLKDKYSEFGEFHTVSGKECIERTVRIKEFLTEKAGNSIMTD